MAGVDVRMDVGHSELPVRASTVLATVLREGVTNLLRHSKARHCAITIRQTDGLATLELVNDDMPSDRGTLTVGGRGGLDDLSVRAAEIGGVVTIEQEPTAFRMRVDVSVAADVVRQNVLACR